MKSKNIENSKYKNTGVLFELLVRQVTADTLAGINESRALTLMKKFFSASTELGKELQLHRAFFEAGTRLTEAKAVHFVDLVLAQRKKLDERKLAREKYELVKEIKSAYSLKDFLSYKIPNYTVHASIYKTFVAEAAKDERVIISNLQDISAARFTLVEHLVGSSKRAPAKPENALLEEFRQQSEDMRLLAYKFLIDKFNEKYSNLSDKQKSLLREYINNVANTNSFGQYVRTELPIIRSQLIACSDNARDKVLSIKINEVASQLDKIEKNRGEVKDNEVTALMIAYEIIKEMRS
jgi:hypothetical protein